MTFGLVAALVVAFLAIGAAGYFRGYADGAKRALETAAKDNGWLRAQLERAWGSGDLPPVSSGRLPAVVHNGVRS